MKIGVYFTPYKEQGGVYSYSVEILEALYNIPGNEYVVISTSPDIPDKYRTSNRFKIIDANTEARKFVISARDFFAGPLALFTGWIINFLNRARLFTLVTPLYRLSNRGYLRLLSKEKLDLVFYPTSSYISFLSDIPSVVTVHDLQHRLNPQFKEVSAGGRWEYREYGFLEIAQKAFRVFVDSVVGREDMVKFYPKSKNRVEILPYLAPSYLDVKISEMEARRATEKFNLPERYIYYPAKFWPHKNHANLIKALRILKKKRLKVDLVLSGSKDADFSSFGEVEKLIKRLGLENQVHYLGYLSDLELSSVYRLAKALVMPTFFGPTNIPILEAWFMGIPVIYSDVRGCRDQLGDAGLLVDPKNPSDIADKIKMVYKSPTLVKKLVERGKKRVRKWTKKDFADTIRKTLSDFKKEYGSSKSN